jgi:hypothetical protein
LLRIITFDSNKRAIAARVKPEPVIAINIDFISGIFDHFAPAERCLSFAQFTARFNRRRRDRRRDSHFIQLGTVSFSSISCPFSRLRRRQTNAASGDFS